MREPLHRATALIVFLLTAVGVTCVAYGADRKVVLRVMRDLERAGLVRERKGDGNE